MQDRKEMNRVAWWTRWQDEQGNRDMYIEKEVSTTGWKEIDDENREKTTATETPRRAINKFDTEVGKLAKLPASGVSI